MRPQAVQVRVAAERLAQSRLREVAADFKAMRRSGPYGISPV
jgi:hypothetical protein